MFFVVCLFVCFGQTIVSQLAHQRVSTADIHAAQVCVWLVIQKSVESYILAGSFFNVQLFDDAIVDHS